MAEAEEGKPTSGRPRSGVSLTGLGTREDILAASADLFCSKGFAGTSTHAIAARAGIKQASLYHYFRSKQAVLLELLLGTVTPSLEAASALTGYVQHPAAARLWALCVSDVRLLSAGEHNVGSLYLLPELEGEFFEPFHRLRAELEGHYCGLIADCGFSQEQAREDAGLVLALVENVILQRRRHGSISAERPAVLADAALRMLGLPAEQQEQAHQQGAKIIRQLDAEQQG